MKVYTLEEIADILRVSVSSVRNYIKDGRLKTVNTGGAIRVSEDQLKAYLRGE